MRAHQSLEKDILLGITAGATKKWKPRMRWMVYIKSVTGLYVNELNQLVKETYSEIALIGEQHSQEEKMDKCLIQGEGNGKPLL